MLHPSTIASWLVQNADDLGVRGTNHDITALPGVWSDELTEWLKDKPHKSWFMDDGWQTYLRIEFLVARDAMLYRLTWS
jgi:hypothetical protein